MFITHSSGREWLRERLLASGACAVGFAKAGPVDAAESERFAEWLNRGNNAGMEYMHNYPELREDPRLLLEGAKTVISLAYSYKPEEYRPPQNGIIASYAYGKDYHKELRKLLRPALRGIEERFPDALFRICIDSAPVRERYWAVKSGIGFRGDNGCVIVPGYGSMVFLAEILTTFEIEPDEPLTQDCGHCGACERSCPGNALKRGVMDCRRCISYLTIEHRGDWDETGAELMRSQGDKVTILGCEICQRVCPHNMAAPPTNVEAFRPHKEIMSLTADHIITMAEEGAPPQEGEKLFKQRFPNSPLSRAGLRGLYRNVKGGIVKDC